MASRLPPAPFLYPIVDVSQAGARGVARVVATVAAAGAKVIQLRGKGITDGAFLVAACEARGAAHALGALLVVNDRADLAVLSGADGVHVGQTDLAPSDARRLLGEKGLVGLSTHSRPQLEAALGQPVDYVAVGPVFATASKVDADPVTGLGLIREARSLTRLPLVAIGGITPDRTSEVLDAGADGLAVISGIWSRGDPGEGVRLFLEAIRRAG